MNRDKLQQQLRTVLSWREKALGLQAESAEAAVRGRIDTEQDAFNKTSLESHLIAAQTHLKDLRREIAAQLTASGERLQKLLREQQHIVAAATTGELAPAKANAENRRVTGALDSLRAEIAAWNQLLHAESAVQAGGYVDLPLDAYAPRIDVAPPAPKPGFWRENRVTLVLATLALLIGVGSILYLRVWRDSVAFQAFLPPAAGQPLILECQNTTMDTLTWHVPVTADEAMSGPAYGVEMLIREKDSKAFRLFTPTQPLWSFEGTPTSHTEAIAVPSGLSMRVSLDTALLKELVPAAETLIVECIDSAGAVRFSATLDLL